ncbi:MAG: ribulose 1,5-bisphosphate carboxylase, partial [Gemmatimonadales bacterium]|nr:ribulose 1,5-bisphosphate carboxylase [Gemmatimonadales bacterium]NIR00612.1 ribulose 1,5-bisphosphate carboxylase [Gemmatimonadales bacterium]
MYDPITFRIPESLADSDHVVATYLYQTRAAVSIHKLARALSEEQSCGTWLDLPGET